MSEAHIVAIIWGLFATCLNCSVLAFHYGKQSGVDRSARASLEEVEPKWWRDAKIDASAKRMKEQL